MKLRVLGACALLACPMVWAAPNGMGRVEGGAKLTGVPASARPGPVISLLRTTPNEVLSGDLEGRLLRWSFADGKLGEGLPAGTVGGAVLDLVAFGEHVLAVDDSGGVWRISGRPEPELVAKHPGGAAALAALADGSLFATAGADGVIRLWGSAGAERGELRGHAGPVAELAFDPQDATRLWSVGHDGTLRTWKLTGGKGDKPFKGKSKAEQVSRRELTGLAVSPNGETLLSCGYTGEVTRWAVEKRKLVPTPLPKREFAENARRVAVSPEGKRAVVVLPGEGALWLIELEGNAAPKLIERGEDAPASAEFVDEDTLAVGGFAGKVARVALGGGK